MGEIINGKLIASKIIESLKKDVEKLNKNGIYPKLAVILIGNDEASKIYVRNKSKTCNEIGIKYEEFFLDEKISQEELLDLIDNLNSRKDITGILLQSPIPKNLDIQEAFQRISPDKDVDGFNPINIGMVQINREIFIPCTPLGILEMFKEYNIELSGKNIVVIGRSNIVGKPMAQVLINRDATVTIAHSKTQNLKEITKRADIIISAVGKERFITKEMLKKEVVIIDVGINRDKKTGKICGDVDFENVKDIASYITPVPGGVGPMTIAMLMNNIILAAKREDIENEN